MMSSNPHVDTGDQPLALALEPLPSLRVCPAPARVLHAQLDWRKALATKGVVVKDKKIPKRQPKGTAQRSEPKRPRRQRDLEG